MSTNFFAKPSRPISATAGAKSTPRHDRAAEAAALEAALAVVPEPSEDAPQRLGTGVEDRPSGVVLEPGERRAGPVAFEQHVADHPPLAGDRVEREQPDAGQHAPEPVAVEAAEQLIAAADREHGGAAGDRLPQRLALRGEVVRDERLLSILPAAD